MMWRNILHVELVGLGLDVHVGALAGALILVLIVASLLAMRGGRFWRVTRANFTFAGCGQVDICPDNDVARIAHQAWVELKTRKAAIPFDVEHDVIVDVYSSWYELFRGLRDLAKTIPAECVRVNRDAPILLQALMGVLNEGLRPHLTAWQARFRRWFALALEGDTSGRSPQEIQRDYPEYDALIADLLRVNYELVQFAEELRKLAHERRREPWLWRILRRPGRQVVSSST